MTYGLIGEKLGHSYSKIIHEKLGEYEYQMFPLSREELDDFLTARNFCGLNVTIPYKKAVIHYCDRISSLAKRLGAVNTLYFNEQNELCGTNTDYHGFLKASALGGLIFEGKKILILGDGGTSGTISNAVLDSGAREVIFATRKPTAGQTVNYSDIQLHADAEIIINTTPVGMYPNNGGSLIDLADFPRCSGVFDVVYNPYFTRLILQAKSLGLPHANGLAMLVAQATKAAEFFTGGKNFGNMDIRITSELKEEITNLIIIGMPGSGKTSIGRELAALTGKSFVDMDEEIVKRSGKDIPTIFAESGEEYFRDLETEVAKDLGKKSRLVIATGGGVILRPENMAELAQNGSVIFIERPLEVLATDGRPLSKDAEALKKMYAIRHPLYQKYSDLEVQCGRDPKANAAMILKQLQTL